MLFIISVSSGMADLTVFARITQLLQSFKIMDYSLLVGIHNLDQACREHVNIESAAAGAADQRRPQGQKSLYSTAIEAIEAEAGMGSMDTEDK